MSGMQSRSKGARGERELAALLTEHLGASVKRRVRQHEGDSDLEGVPGWCIESKNCAELRVSEWWRQAVEQAQKSERFVLPVLFYKIPRKGWRAMWPMSVLVGEVNFWPSEEYAVTSSIAAWCAVAREGM